MKRIWKSPSRQPLRRERGIQQPEPPISSTALALSVWDVPPAENVAVRNAARLASENSEAAIRSPGPARPRRIILRVGARGFLNLILALPPLAAHASGNDPSHNLAALIADRVAIECVYYEHRLGQKQPFEQLLRPGDVEALVRADLKKLAVLKNAYGVEPTPQRVEAEVRRIEIETRAPEMLAEIKSALGNDPARFARSVARPIVVEQELRRRFENDARLHAVQRQQAEAARRKILTTRQQKDSWPAILQTLKEIKAGTTGEVSWDLGGRPPTEPTAGSQSPVAPPTPTQARGGKYSLDATAQWLSAAEAAAEAKGRPCLDDLRPELRSLLRAQLQKPGDVTAVIETPTDFLLFVAKEKTTDTLSAAALSIPKRSFEQWLAEPKE